MQRKNYVHGMECKRIFVGGIRLFYGRRKQEERRTRFIPDWEGQVKIHRFISPVDILRHL